MGSFPRCPQWVIWPQWVLLLKLFQDIQSIFGDIFWVLPSILSLLPILNCLSSIKYFFYFFQLFSLFFTLNRGFIDFFNDFLVDVFKLQPGFFLQFQVMSNFEVAAGFSQTLIQSSKPIVFPIFALYYHTVKQWSKMWFSSSGRVSC